MLTAIVDLQFGSTGKGLMAGYLSQKNDYDLVVSANMPNAGHTFVDVRGRKWINKVLPSGVYSPSLTFICIGPGAVFEPSQLVREIAELREREINARVVIHPNAGILMHAHREMEQKALSGISSTMQGSMEAQIHKMRRYETGPNTAEHNHGLLFQFNTPDGLTLWDSVMSHREWQEITDSAQNILMEGSQGYSLGINAGFYPRCTSRDCTVWRLLSDCGMTVKDRMKVVGTARVHPIRVGNTHDGHSGGHYHDQDETCWEDIGVMPEYTTVTKRVRRVFTFSDAQVREAVRANRVDEVFLNFCNYDPRQAIAIQKRLDNMFKDEFIGRSQFNALGDAPPLVRYMGFGPQAEDILEVRHYDY